MLLFVGVAFGALLYVLTDPVRGTPVRRLIEAPGASVQVRTSDPGFVGLAAALTETALEPGHTVEVLTDTVLFERMFQDFAAARRSVTVMGYYCEPGQLGDRFARALAERARAGVEVLFLADDFACDELVDAVRPTLEAAGVEVASFRPVRLGNLLKAQHRMHARSVVIDGVIGYGGGFGIADKWVTSRPDDPLWRDTSVRFSGPAVREFQASFLTAWAEATGELVTGAAFLPADSTEWREGAMDGAGGALAGELYSRAGLGPTAAERYLSLTLAAAERTLFISNAYFVPPPSLRRLLMDAAARGVDVRVLVPGPRIDIPSTRYAGRGLYEELLSAGVRIWEYQPAMMHAKTLVVDGVWSGVGSLNFDSRSLRVNDESALLVYDTVVGGTMDSLFLQDLGRAQEITLERHQERSFWERVIERTMLMAAPVL